MTATATGVRDDAVLVVGGAGGRAAVPVILAAKVGHGAEVGAIVVAGVLNERRVEGVARADLVGGATVGVGVEVAAEAEAAVADRVEPGAGGGAEGGAAVGAAAPVAVLAVAVVAAAAAAVAQVEVATAIPKKGPDLVKKKRTSGSWRRLGDVRKFRIRL